MSEPRLTQTTISEMMKRVERAIYAELERQADASRDATFKPYDRDSLRLNGTFDPIKVARAAIASMREPTEEMVRVGMAYCPEDAFVCVPELFRAMIDKALEEA